MRNFVYLVDFSTNIDTELNVPVLVSYEFWWQVNQKMILTLTASIMYWSLHQKGQKRIPSEDNKSPVASPVASGDGDHETLPTDDASSELPEAEEPR